MEKATLVIAVIIFFLRLILEGEKQYRHQRRWRQVSLTGRLLYGVLVIAICFAAWGIGELYNNWYYEEGPAPYASVEAAAADGCVVIEGLGTFLDGEENWEEFLRYSQKGLAAAAPIAFSTGSAVTVVDQLYFDGVLYHYTDNTPYIHQDSVTEAYPYLLFLVKVPDPEAGERYSRMESWVLTDKPDLTLDELPQIEYEEATGKVSSGYRARRLTLYYEWLPEEKLFGP